MKPLSLRLFLLLLVSLAGVRAGQAASPGTNAKPVEQAVTELMKAIDSGNSTEVARYSSTKKSEYPSLTWDLDFDNKPVTVDGNATTPQSDYLEVALERVRKGEMKIASKVSQLQARTFSKTAAYATFVLTQTTTTGGKTRTDTFNVTSLLAREGAEKHWRIFHWHASLAGAR